MEQVDAVVIGAGPNGLVAANVLADAGWSVLVCESGPEPGGAVRSAELILRGYSHDVFSAFYPLALASPALRALDLESYGLRWTQAPAVMGQVLSDDDAVVLHRDRELTADSLARYAPADGEAWLRLCEQWDRVGPAVMGALLSPFPPVRSGVRLARALGAAQGLDLARRAAQPLRAWVEEEFAGDGARALLAGAAMHTDLGPSEVGSAVFGWILAMLAQEYGFPVPVGGAGRTELTSWRRHRGRVRPGSCRRRRTGGHPGGAARAGVRIVAPACSHRR